MKDLKSVSKIGMGCYRMSINNESHIKTLKYAYDNGITLIDTASNYRNGNSEKLIGKVFGSTSLRKSVFITSKAGYIFGDDIELFSSFLNDSKTIKIQGNSFYSLHTGFLEAQIKNSLKRLNTDYIDSYLIHNPEYYLKDGNITKEDFYDYLKEALFFLEESVKKGDIRYYGISSNVLHKNEIDLNKLPLNKLNGFKIIQFPYNIIENEAVNKTTNQLSLLDFCKKNNLTTFSNRPLNTVYNKKVLRIVDYSNNLISFNPLDEETLFKEFITEINQQLIKINPDFKVNDFPILKFLIENRQNIVSTEGVLKTVELHVTPLLKQLNFEKTKPFELLSKLKEFWINYSKLYNSNRVQELRKGLIAKNIISKNDTRSISKIICEKYLNDGIDHVLIGMRQQSYVDDFISLL